MTTRWFEGDQILRDGSHEKPTKHNCTAT